MIDEQENASRIHREKAVLFFEQGRYREARTEIQAALAIKPEDWYSRRLLVMILDHLGLKDEALNLCEALLAEYPDEPTAMTDLAQLYIARDKISKAKDLVDAAMQIDCLDADVFDLAGRIASKQDDIEKMYQYSQRAYELDPHDEVHVINFAVANVRLNRKEEARRLYLQALEMNPVSVSAHYCYATHLEVEGELDEALKHIKETLRLAPNHKDARKQLVRHLQHKIPVVSSLLGLSERIYWYQIAQVSKEENNTFLELIFAMICGVPRFILDSFSVLILRLDARTKDHVPGSMHMRNNLSVLVSLFLIALISSPVVFFDKVMAGTQPQVPISRVTLDNSEKYFEEFRAEYTGGKPLSATRDDLELLHKIELERPQVNLYRRLLTTLYLYVFEEGRLQFVHGQHYLQEAADLANLIASKSTTPQQKKEDALTQKLLSGYVDYINLQRDTRPDSPLWLANKGSLEK